MPAMITMPTMPAMLAMIIMSAMSAKDITSAISVEKPRTCSPGLPNYGYKTADNPFSDGYILNNLRIFVGTRFAPGYRARPRNYAK